MINKNPIICICNNVNKSVNPLLSSVIHIEFNKPNDNDIYQLLSKINIDEKLNINPILLNLIIPYCQYDFRRTIYIMEFISSFVKNNKINNDSLIKLLDNIGNKDIDLPLFDAVDNVLNNSDLKYDELLHNFDSDQNFVPFIIHENFIDFIDKNTNNNYIEKIRFMPRIL